MYRKVPKWQLSSSPNSDWLFDVSLAVMIATVRCDDFNLTARQLAVFLICYRESEPQTVRGLSQKLGISRPAVTRILDRLGECELTYRKPDPSDGRSVLVGTTPEGQHFLHMLMEAMAAAPETAKELRQAGKSTAGPAPSAGPQMRISPRVAKRRIA